MNILNEIFGAGKDLTTLQMCARAFVFFFITLFYLRIGGIRTIGKKSSIDMIVIIILGSVIARGIAGASPFGTTAASSAVLVLVHRIVAWLSLKSNWIEKLVKGNAVILFQNGKFNTHEMKKANITRNDFIESLRLEIQSEDTTGIDRAYLETNGTISFIKK